MIWSIGTIVNSAKPASITVEPKFTEEVIDWRKNGIKNINLDSSKSKISKLKGFIVNGKEKAENSISHLDIEPLAYMLRMDENEFLIEPIDEKYEKIVKDNEKELLNQFLEKK